MKLLLDLPDSEKLIGTVSELVPIMLASVYSDRDAIRGHVEAGGVVVRWERVADAYGVIEDVEHRIVRRVFDALETAGNPVVAVFDGGQRIECSTLDEVFSVVFDVDFSTIITQSGATVSIVCGNEWDALSDYSMSLEPALAAVNAWIDENN